MMLLLFLIILCQLITVGLGASTQWIFSTYPLYKVSVDNAENSIEQIVESSQSHLIFLAAGQEGLKIFDTENQREIQKILDKGEITKLTLTNDGKFIFFFYKGYMSSFSLDMDTSGYHLNLLGQETSKIGAKVNFLILMNDEKWAAAASDDLLVIYDISNKSEFKIIGQISTGMSSFQVVQVKNSYLYVIQEFIKIVRYTEQNGNVILNIILEIASDFIFTHIAITSDDKFIYALDSRGGFFFGRFLDLNLIQHGTLKTDFKFDVTKWWPISSTAFPNNIILTKDDNFALIGVNQIGIYVFDISQKETQIIPQLFQLIRSTGFSYSFVLSKDQNQFYYSNGESFLAYQKIQPNFNDDVPNIFNTMQTNFTDVAGLDLYSRCYVTANDEYFIGGFEMSGMLIFDLHNNPFNLQLKQKVLPFNAQLRNSVLIDEKNGYIIVAGDHLQYLLFAYVISDIQGNTPFLPVFSLVYNQNVLIEGITYNNDQSLIGIGGHNRIILVDTSKGPLQMEVISNLLIENNEFVEIAFSNDNNYIVAASRNQGFASINIKDPRNPFIEFFLRTKGAFNVVVSRDRTVIFAADGSRGIILIDISKLPMINIVSRLAIDGAAFHLKPIMNDRFLLVSSEIVGFISLVDARDYNNLYVIAKYGVNGQNGIASCTNHEDTFAFFINHKGITSIPLRNTVKIHTELFRITGIETQTKVYSQMKFVDSILYVSQQFQMKFYQIYPKYKGRITNVFLYDKFEVVSLPTWLLFQNKLAILNIEVVKQALGTEISKNVLITLLIQHQIPLQSSDFVINEDGVTINQADSIRIHSQLRLMGLLDIESFLITSKFEKQENFLFKDISLNVSKSLLDKVKKIMQQSVSYNPVRFMVASSLQFFENPKSKSTEDSNSDQLVFVFSLQSKVQFYLQTQLGDGKFVELSYKGVNSQISNQQTKIKLDGSVVNINEILKNRILFFRISKDPIIFHLMVVDGINFNIDKYIKLEETQHFIALKRTLYLKEGNSLQQQFNKQFSDGTLFIEQSISFEFSQDTFINPDTQVINYVASFNVNGTYADSLEGFWIQQSSNSLRFFGLIPASQFRTILRINVTASDGYTSVSDEFTINVYGVPFFYIFSSIIQIFGPIFTIFGLYKYRSLFFNIFFRKRNFYKTEQVQVNTPFLKKFALISKENIKAILLFEQFIAKSSFTQLRNSLPGSISLKQDQLQQNAFDSQTILMMNQPNINNESNQLIQSLLLNNKNIQLILQQIRVILKQKNTGTYETNNKDQPQKQKKQKKDRKTEHSRFQLLVQSLMGDSNQVQMERLIECMSNLQLIIRINSQPIKFDQLISDLKEPSSRIHQALKAVSSRYVLRQFPLLNLVYRFLKESAQLEFKYMFNSEKNWYMKYARFDIDPSTNSQIIDSLLSSFPTFSLDHFMIKNQLNRLEQLLDLQSKETSLLFNKYALHLQLLFDVIRADVLGLVESPPSIFQPSNGESIHLDFFNIDSARAFKRADNLFCSFFRHLCDLDYMNYGPIINQQLPSWMKFTHKSSVIILSGTPQKEDIETFLVRIFDGDGYIVRQFQVEVIDSQSQSMQNISEDEEQVSLIPEMIDKGEIIVQRNDELPLD